MHLTLVKIGGNVIDNPEACAAFLQAFAQLPSPKILVHGGGKIATQTAAQLGIETNMVEGRRITDRPMLDVVTMVYGGLVNKNLVAQLQANHCNAIGLTGADGGIIRSVKRPVKTIDYGFVGDIEEVNAGQLQSLLTSGLVPVIAPAHVQPRRATTQYQRRHDGFGHGRSPGRYLYRQSDLLF